MTDKQIERKVKLVRSIMKITAKDMVDMKASVGKDTFFDTKTGPVRALTYGFEREEALPLLINIHGSGFVLGSAAMDDQFMMQFVEKCNVKVISIDYTLAPEGRFPVALNQCYSLIEYAKENQEKLKIDPDRIMLMGHSAGGNFSAAIGIMENEENRLALKGIILDYPPTDIATSPYDKPRPKGALPPRLSLIFDAAYADESERKNPLVSPRYASVNMVRNFPPTLIITAGRDSLRAEAEDFRDTLIKAGADVTYRCFEKAFHGFTVLPERLSKKLSEQHTMATEAWQMMIDFVNEHI